MRTNLKELSRPSALVAAAVVALAALTAQAQDASQYNRAFTAYNAGDFDTAAQIFFELSETSTDPEVKPKSEYYLAQSLARRGLPITASILFRQILMTEGGKHPHYRDSVAALVNIQAQLDDQFLIPNIINESYGTEASEQWAQLPAEVRARIDYLIGGLSRRRARLEEAQAFLEAVPRETAVYAQARYLLGVTLADPRFPGRAEDEKVARDLDARAIAHFEEVLALDDAKQVELENTKLLARLGLGRVHYGAGDYAKAVEAYEGVPRFSRYWNVALFENGFARFQNEDFGGALGSLQALYAPQFVGAFQPESRTLTATVYFFSCLYEESKAALKDFDDIYVPMQDSLRPLLEGEERERQYYYELITTQQAKLPRPVLLWVRGNERLSNVLALVEQVKKERELIGSVQNWRRARMSEALNSYLDVPDGTLRNAAGELVRNRLVEASALIKEFSDQAKIIRFEIAKGERQIVESGVDQGQMLAEQNLYRPRMPAENWNYWKFQGEFWIDEIGYYQYTLKRGCPAADEE